MYIQNLNLHLQFRLTSAITFLSFTGRVHISSATSHMLFYKYKFSAKETTHIEEKDSIE